MKVLIIEDEFAAAENLKYLLKEIDPSIHIEMVIDSVEEAIIYFKGNISSELVFMDIHLADGISFEIFEKVQVNIPIIFTTAYDEYAIKAFKVNSIDYLLKPIDDDELKEAIAKYKNTQNLASDHFQIKNLFELLHNSHSNFKKIYLVQQRDILIPLDISDIAYFTIEESIVKAISIDNKSYIIDKKLEDIEAELDPDKFFRVNRQFIVQRKAIESLQLYFNGKLLLNVSPKSNEHIVISKAKAPLLKQWINI